MRRVITVNLGGVACLLDEDAYELLRDYIDRAERRLASNPDRAEILADLERSLAEKCGAFRDGFRSVVSAAAIQRIIADTGPLEDREPAGFATGGGAAGAGAARGGDRTTLPGGRRLVQRRSSGIISGVCSGLSAHLGIDVTLLRIGFVVLAVLTSGLGLLAYVAMMFLIPFDPDERDAPDQGLPAFAYRLVSKAKSHLGASTSA